MKTTTPWFTGRRIAAGVAGLTTVTAVAILAAPAHATVDSITVSGTEHTVNNTYTLRAELSGASFGLLVYWNDNGEAITGPKVPWPVGESSVDWTPKTSGQHVITASQGSSTKSLIVNVASTSTPPPTTTTPPPTTTTPPPTTTTPPPTTTTTTPPPTTTTTTTTEPPVTTTPPKPNTGSFGG
ncbi:hypothetical protein [Nocardia arizonensis]|uniref:hypothetical protein n=1 Tax=Nocardia arizonensis TaxID=1141647 RepID=UPI0006D20F7F|nr:hypothetical protein [Nocardia arizonensis]